MNQSHDQKMSAYFKAPPKTRIINEWNDTSNLSQLEFFAD